MPRLFTGIEVPQSVSMPLSFMQSGLPGARWIEPSDFHITLSFIGDISWSEAREVADMLGRLEKPTFDLRVSGLDVFTPKQPSSIFARVVPEEKLAVLQASHDSILRRLGLPRDKRSFTPHVTLARVKACRPKDVGQWLVRNGGFMSAPFPVSRFVLYSARDSVGGGPYVPEETFDLAQPIAA